MSCSAEPALLCTCLNININYDKSHLEPTQMIIYLGMDIHSPLLRVFSSQERIDNLLQVLYNLMSSLRQPAKTWLSLLRHMSSLTHLVPGHVASLIHLVSGVLPLSWMGQTML